MRKCSVKGVLSAGLNCAESNTGTTSEMNFEESIRFIEPQAPMPDPADPSKTIPGHGPAIIMSSEDAEKETVAMDQACRDLGASCSYELKTAIDRAKDRLKVVQSIRAPKPLVDSQKRPSDTETR